MRSSFCVKGWILLYPSKTWNILITFCLLNYHLGMLIVYTFQVSKKIVVRANCVIVSIHLLNKFRRFMKKNLLDEEIKTLNNSIENNDLVMQKASKSNTIVILNKNQILDDTWKFKSFYVEEGKALNLIIQLKISKNQNEILEKSCINLCLSG